MKKEKVILFDWGNIVESHTLGYNVFDAQRDLFTELGWNCQEKKIFSGYDISSMSTMEEYKKFFYEIKKKYNLNCDFEQYLERYAYYHGKITYFQDVRDFEESLKDKCYIGMFSNLSIIDKERLDRQVGLDNYDYLFLSFEFGCQKPDERIYRMVEEKLPFKGKDILFIDDDENNIAMAKKMGWEAVQLDATKLDDMKNVCRDFISR